MPDMLHCLSDCVALQYSNVRLTCLADSLHSIPAVSWYWAYWRDFCREACCDSDSLTGLDIRLVRVPYSLSRGPEFEAPMMSLLYSLTLNRKYRTQTTCLCNLIKLSLIKFNFPLTLSLSRTFYTIKCRKIYMANIIFLPTVVIHPFL
jgi:hypothetical protein